MRGYPRKPDLLIRFVTFKFRPSDFPKMRTTGGLSYRHGFRRSHGQLQHIAQRRQVRIPWTNAIVLPEVNAGLADTDLLGNFGNR
jgi:hypothetical protein